MKRVLSDSAEVYHYWANQLQEYGRAGSVHFDGPRLYSYSTCIGRIIESPPLGVALLTTRKFSVTTSGHVSAAASAASHLRRLHAYDPDPLNNEDHRRNLNRLRDDIIAAAEKQKRARKEYRRELHGREQIELAETFAAYVTLFKLETMAAAEYPGVADIDIEGIRAGIAAGKAAAALEQAKAAKREKAAVARRLRDWRAGKGGPIYNMGFAALRLAPDRTEIETSKGVRVRVRVARRLWEGILAARAMKKDITPDITVDKYKVTMIKANGELRIGCHIIPYAESKRMAGELGFETEGGAV